MVLLWGLVNTKKGRYIDVLHSALNIRATLRFYHYSYPSCSMRTSAFPRVTLRSPTVPNLFTW